MVEEDWATELPVASDADLGVTCGGANPSAGEASSSRPAPPEGEVLEISSSGDEDFLVAPSR